MLGDKMTNSRACACSELRILWILLPDASPANLASVVGCGWCQVRKRLTSMPTGTFSNCSPRGVSKISLREEARNEAGENGYEWMPGKGGSTFCNPDWHGSIIC